MRKEKIIMIIRGFLVCNKIPTYVEFLIQFIDPNYA